MLYQTKVIVNGVEVSFLVSTTGNCTYVTEADYKRIGSPGVEEEAVLLSSAGKTFASDGLFNCESVHYEGKPFANFHCLLLKSADSSVLQLDWIPKLKGVWDFPGYNVVPIEATGSIASVCYASEEEMKKFKKQSEKQKKVKVFTGRIKKFLHLK